MPLTGFLSSILKYCKRQGSHPVRPLLSLSVYLPPSGLGYYCKHSAVGDSDLKDWASRITDFCCHYLFFLSSGLSSLYLRAAALNVCFCFAQCSLSFQTSVFVNLSVAEVHKQSVLFFLHLWICCFFLLSFLSLFLPFFFPSSPARVLLLSLRESGGAVLPFDWQL